ncbi:MAG TPA: DUF5663 domain-containing protein [Patescibacteria group bacterium]|nr:DUF5663 domain-containing protein [Patescibacteria group bacterium]
MPLLSPTLLENLGINLSEEHYQALAEHFETTLNERVINEIVLELSPEQAEQLATLQQAGDEEVLAWLKANVPDVAEIVTDEVDILLGEIAENSETISDN